MSFRGPIAQVLSRACQGTALLTILLLVLSAAPSPACAEQPASNAVTLPAYRVPIESQPNLVPEMEDMWIRHFFDRIDLGYPVGSWHPVDVDGDGTWELAARLAGTPVRVGVFDPARGLWVDGPRQVPVTGTQWGVGDWNRDGALEYAYRSDRAIRRFDTRTERDSVLWNVNFAPADMVVWGDDNQGHALVGILQGFSAPWGDDGRKSSSVWQVYRLLTGESVTAVPGGLGSVRPLYWPSETNSARLAVHEGYSWYKQPPMMGEEGYYWQNLRILRNDWSVRMLFTLPGLHTRMELLTSLWGLRHAAVIPPADGFGYGVAWYVLSLHGAGVSAPQYLGVSGGPSWSEQVVDCHYCPPGGDIFAGVAVYDVTDDGRDDLILPLISGEGWEVRDVRSNHSVDTLEGLPPADLRAGALFTPGRFDLFYVKGDALYVWDDGDAIDRTVQTTAIRPPMLRAVPNPFNAAVTLTWSATESPQALEIYNVLGQCVRVFDLAGDSRSGSLSWNGADQTGRPLASGIYLARLVGASESTVVKLVLLK